MNSLTNKEKIQNTIDELYETYKEDEYMNQKMVSYICSQMPNILSNMKQNHLDRVARIQEMTNEQDTFIQSFFKVEMSIHCFRLGVYPTLLRCVQVNIKVPFMIPQCPG